MFWNKKGSEMSMNIIIIAAIALLILVILAVMLLNKTNEVNVATGCESFGGYCASKDACQAGEFAKPDTACSKSHVDGVCCLKLGS